MSQDTIKQQISSVLPSATFNENKQFVEVVIASNEWTASANVLKTQLGFDYLVSLSGVDYAQGYGVVGHLRNTSNGSQIVIKAILADKVAPAIETLCKTWATAEFFEREIYDLLGVNFVNHPDLRRLFLEDDFVGHPLRKDFVDDINIIER